MDHVPGRGGKGRCHRGMHE